MAGLPRHVAAALLFVVATAGASTYYASDPNLGSSRVVFQTNHGDIEFSFFPHVAPKTVEHIFKLVRLGCYNTNHFFRVDKGFVAQVADVVGGRTAPMNVSRNNKQRNQLSVNLVLSSMSGEFSPWEGTLIQTVLPLPFLSFLVMLHTSMASMLYLGESLRVMIHCGNLSVFQPGKKAFL